MLSLLRIHLDCIHDSNGIINHESTRIQWLPFYFLQFDIHYIFSLVATIIQL